jgi:hypothetical protein
MSSDSQGDSEAATETSMSSSIHAGFSTKPTWSSATIGPGWLPSPNLAASTSAVRGPPNHTVAANAQSTIARTVHRDEVALI